jgi:hypothetical protein
MIIREAGETIAQTFENWLRAEVISSGIERNTVLDDYERALPGLKRGYDDPENYVAAKHEAHVFTRMPIWWEAFVTTPPEHPKYDEMAAQISFNALMQVSGTYRDQCYLQATDPEIDPDDYINRRQSRPIGVNNLPAVVNARLATHFLANDWDKEADFATASIDISELDRTRQKAIRIGDEAVKTMCARVAEGKDLHQEESESVREMLDAQYNWLTLAIDCVTLAAKIRRGDLAAVPFLEPKSISADPPPQVIYPLAPKFAGF